MSLRFYKDAAGTSETSGVATIHNGFAGEADLITVYLKNDDPNKLYRNVEVRLEIGAQLYTNGWRSKVHLGDDIVSLQEWAELEATTTIEQISDTTTAYALQFRLFCPAGEESKVYTSTDDFNIKLTAVEFDLD